MIYLNEGDKHYVQGSGKQPYEVKKSGGVVSCSCPAWRNLGGPIDTRVCKHIRKEIDPTCLLPQAQSPGREVTAPQKIVKATQPPCLLAHTWVDEDPTGWWMSEKMDGVRAWWDGEKFLSRLGNVFHAPDWFKAQMPQGVVLDGELFGGRKTFQRTVSAVRKLIPSDTEWRAIQYVIFDAPNAGVPFELRLEALKELPESKVYSILPQELCQSKAQFDKYLKAVEAAGGEGLMLRKARSMYEAGRSTTLLKVKSFLEDEAVVTGYSPGKGRHKGRVGALQVRWNGVAFEVGTGLSDKERDNPPVVGSKITFRFQELTDGGIPRFPSYVGERDYE